MKKSNILYIAFLSIALSAMMTSCSKEDMDTEMTTPEDIEVEIELGDTTYTCDSMYVYCNDFQFNAFGKANLFKIGSNCETGGSNSPLNYQILDSSWDEWGMTPSIFNATDGIPGFSFGTEIDAQVGDKITMWRSHVGSQTLFKTDDSNDFYSLANDYEITLSEVGDELGEYIGGEFSGQYINLTTNVAHDFHAGFCVPITYVCE